MQRADDSAPARGEAPAPVEGAILAAPAATEAGASGKPVPATTRSRLDSVDLF